MRACAGMPRCRTRRGNTPSSWTAAHGRDPARPRHPASRTWRWPPATTGPAAWSRLRQSRDGARGPRPARRGGPAARALPVGSLPALAAGAAVDAPPRHEHAWERVGQRFTMAGILDARQRSLDAVRDIAALIRPGMTTRDAVNAADAHLRGMGAPHNWHPTYARFGADTQSPAVQPTDFQRVLRDDDTFVVDIGPVWDGYEGDYGDTFVTGRDDAGARCARAAREVFAAPGSAGWPARPARRCTTAPTPMPANTAARWCARSPATASRISRTRCTASTSWRTPTSRPPTASGCWRSGARPGAAGRRLLKTCCCARPEATRADLQPDRYAQASARPLRFRQIVALQSGSCGSTSRFNCSSDSCQPR